MYGYKEENGSLIPEATEQANIALIVHLREQGNSYNRIAEHLNEIVVQSRTGNIWRSEQIRRIILNVDDRRKLNVANSGKVFATTSTQF